MAKDYLVEAIFKLRPEAEFVIFENDYSKIEWHELKGNAPTKSEIDAAIEEIKNADLAAEAKSQADKADLLAKLGITEEEAKLLLN